MTILALNTAVPKYSLSQEKFTSVSSKHLDQQKASLLERITAATHIEKRHTIFPNFCPTALNHTQQRNLLYKEEAPLLAEQACKPIVTNPEEITHVISVSCTGMFAPGIEFLLIDRLGLSPHVERLGINFMGCFGAFKGLSVANAIAKENPKHRVLLVCTELCSLHFQDDSAPDTLISNSLFADGAAAAIIGTDENPLLEIHNHASEALSNTLDHMTWETGNFGYEMRLSAEVPHFVEQKILPFVTRLTNGQDNTAWAVHPGGKAILEAVTRACQLDPTSLSASWNILKNYGNMSSPTFLFVLEELLKQRPNKEWITGLGFGPGLSFEGMLFKYVAR